MNTLKELLSCITSEHVYIQTHNFPDPDAIASAFGLQKLLLTKNIASTICYFGEIERYSTSQMVSALGIDINYIPTLPDRNENDDIILVDSQKGNSNVKNNLQKKLICIDHHPTVEDVEYKFKDIRTDVGACSSIIAEYFFLNDIPIEKATATALIYGIKIDTANLTRGLSHFDLDMFYLLYQHSDLDILRYLEQSTIQFDDLSAYAHAINSIQVYNSISFANTGSNCPEALIASISDFMLSLAEVKFSVVYSIKTDGIKLSIRSETENYDAGKISHQALAGIGDGGGHSTMAGGFVPFYDFSIIPEALIKIIQSRFLEILSKT